MLIDRNPIYICPALAKAANPLCQINQLFPWLVPEVAKPVPKAVCMFRDACSFCEDILNMS
jgi:hypothetical protein